MKDHAPGPAVAPEPEAAARSTGRQELGGFSPVSVLALQRAAGNAAVNRILARRERAPDATTTQTQDWSAADREGNTARWQSANEANLLAGRSSEYTSPLERSAFYRWFYIATTTHPDPARRSECRWPLAASVVAAGVWGMVDMPNSEGLAKTAGVTTEETQTILRRGNQVIMDDVFPKLRDLWLNPRRGQAAIDWDAETLAEEQNLVQPLYDGASAEANDDPAEHGGRDVDVGAVRRVGVRGRDGAAGPEHPRRPGAVLHRADARHAEPLALREPDRQHVLHDLADRDRAGVAAQRRRQLLGREHVRLARLEAPPA